MRAAPLEFAAQPAVLRAALDVCQCIAQAGGCAHFVGGCVRDALRRQPISDVDIEVFGLPAAQVRRILEAHFPLDLVGASFGVIKLRNLPVDVALPRAESKRGLGHKAFDIVSNPFLSFAEAASRRDFTINAIAYDPLQQTLIDPFHGVDDLQAKILRHVSDKFGEDPLRVLRGMQFIARFELDAAPETIEVCRAMTPETLPPERLFQEWRTLLLKGVDIARGLAFLRATGWVQYYPELAALIGCPQDPRWHPEGDVWTHTLLCLNAFAAERTGNEWDDLIVGLAVLCHDFGKPATTTHETDGIRSFRHELAGAELARQFLLRMTNQHDLIERVCALVAAHMRPQELYQQNAGDSAIRRLARQVQRIDWLARVDRADRLGRGLPPRDGEETADAWLLARARALDVQAAAPKPIVMGRHLQALGLSPGPHFGPVLAKCYEAQLDGAFTTLEEGLAFARRLLHIKT